jgi:hypothetical protein
MVEGGLEGISFVPGQQEKRFFSSGVYGIRAVACTGCGYLSALTLDANALSKILSNKRGQGSLEKNG